MGLILKKLDAMLLGKQDQFLIDLTDDSLSENPCACRCLHLAAPSSAPPDRPESALLLTENVYYLK